MRDAAPVPEGCDDGEHLHAPRNALRANDAAHAILDTVYETSPTGLAFLDAGLRFARVNSAFAAISGETVGAHLGRVVTDVLDIDSSFASVLRRCVAGGADERDVELRLRDVDGRERHVLLSCSAVGGAERPAGVAVALHDITERKRAERDRSRRLRDASTLAALGELLDGRLEADAILAGVTRIAVEHLADWCAVSVPAPDGGLRTPASAARDPELRLRIARVEELFFGPGDSRSASRDVLRTGEPVLVEEVTEAMLADVAEEADALGLLRSLRLSSALVVPLVTRGEVLGVLRMATIGDDRRFDVDDCDLARDIGRRVAAAVDAARLLRVATEERRRAESALARESAARRDLERAHARTRLLADLSGLLESSFDVVPVLDDVCAMLTERLVEHARIDVAADAARHSGRSGADDGEGTARYRLAAAGRTLGTLVVGWGSSDPDPEDVALLCEVARRIALNVDASLRHAERAAAARTLQTSLLPEVLPRVPGLLLAVRYTPAVGGAEVGGDFYDVFPLGDGTWMVVVGDVCGKGVEAASLTSQLRYTLRALGPRRPDPSGLLTELNGFLDGRGQHRFASLVLFRVDRSRAADGEATLDVASAGHPAPFLLHPDGVEVVPGHGPVVGLGLDAAFPAERVTLSPGTVAVAYTDGISEARHDDVRDADALGLEVAEVREDGPSGVAREIEVRARDRAGGALRDDAVVLALALDDD